MTPVCKQKRLREFFLGKRFSRYLNHCMFSFSYDQITSLSIFKDLNWGSSSRAYMITSENLQRFNKSWKKLFLEKILWLYVYCWPNGEIPLLSSSFLGFNFLIRSWDTTWGWLFSFSLYLRNWEIEKNTIKLIKASKENYSSLLLECFLCHWTLKISWNKYHLNI